MIPAELRTAAEVLTWVGKDTARANLALMAELGKHPAQHRHPLIAELRHRLTWPYPDTPPAEVLAGAGTPGISLAHALEAEKTRPAQLRRPDLIAELEARAAQAGEWASCTYQSAPDARPTP